MHLEELIGNVSVYIEIFWVLVADLGILANISMFETGDVRDYWDLFSGKKISRAGI